jgi:hypothetical protein
MIWFVDGETYAEVGRLYQAKIGNESLGCLIAASLLAFPTVPPMREFQKSLNFGLSYQTYDLAADRWGWGRFGLSFLSYYGFGFCSLKNGNEMVA